MERQYGLKLLSLVTVLLAVLLAILATAQFRWSERIADADAIEARQRIETGARAFAQSFELAVRNNVAEAESVGLNALHGGLSQRLPTLVSDLYYLDASGASHLDKDGAFQPFTLPLSMRDAKCSAPAVPRVPAVVIPVLRRPGACLIAKLDTIQLGTLIPGLLDRAYDHVAGQYYFRVQPAAGPEVFYGSALTPEFRQSLYAGSWELDAQQRRESIAGSAAITRRNALLFSAAVEIAIVLAVGFTLLRVRSMLRIADKKMLFVSGLARELRAPVETASVMARRQAAGLHGEGEVARQYGQLLCHQTERIADALERAIEFSGIYALPRPTRLEEVNLGQIIKATLAQTYPQLAMAGFEVEVAVSPGLPTVWGDPQWLRSAFENLLSNACKFGGERRYVRVCAYYVEEAREVRVSVEDRGLGIDAEEVEDIFEPFTRGRRAMAANVSGAGLGLSLVRGTAEAHRGRVSVVSQPNSGSTFTMHLPA